MEFTLFETSQKECLKMWYERNRNDAQSPAEAENL